MSDAPGARAGIVVTGTEVLTGRVSDRNGPWLAERLRELGVQLAYTTIVGDRPQDMHEALSFMAARGLDLVITSGGLGPTADDLTAEVVGRFQGREMRLDPEVEERIAEILRPLAKRFPHVDMEAVREGNRKQATVPEGATVLDPVGTAPGLVVPPPAGPRAPHRRGAARPAPGAAADVGRSRRERGDESRAEGRAARWSSGCCGCSGSPSRRSPRRCGWPNGRGRARAPGDHHLPETRRGGGGERLRPRRSAEVYERVRASRRAPAPRHAVLHRRPLRRPAGGGAAARRRARRPADGRHGRVLHRRAARRPPDRAARLLRLLQGGDRGLRQRRQGARGGRRARP